VTWQHSPDDRGEVERIEARLAELEAEMRELVRLVAMLRARQAERN
jgi:hypothetical protein